MNRFSEYKWKWKHYPQLKLIDRIPLHLDIEITTRCNLSCIFCERTLSQIESLDMPMKTYKKIIDEFSEKGGYAIKLCWLGEPLLHPEIVSMIKYAKDKGIIDVIISTNGTLLNKKLTDGLIRAGLDFIIFSIDSCHEETYGKIRVGGNLNDVIDGLRTINKLKTQYNTIKPKIQIQVIPLLENKEEIESGEYEQFFKEFCDIIDIRPHCEDFINKISYEKESNFFCDYIYQRITIRVDGKIMSCNGTRNEPSKIIGNINENTIEEVWNGEILQNIRKLMNENKSHLIQQCKSCSYRISRIK